MKQGINFLKAALVKELTHSEPQLKLEIKNKFRMLVMLLHQQYSDTCPHLDYLTGLVINGI